MTNRKRFIRWDDGSLAIGPHVRVPEYLVWTTATSLFALYILGGFISVIPYTGWLSAILMAPFVVTVAAAILFFACRFICWFVMEWVYVFQPWKRPEKEKTHYLYY